MLLEKALSVDGCSLQLGELGALPVLLPQFASDTHLKTTEIGHPSIEKLEYLMAAVWCVPARSSSWFLSECLVIPFAMD